MKSKKKNGYVLVTVIIFILLMTITVASGFTVIMRYMLFARDNLQSIGEISANNSFIGELYYGCL